MRVSHVALLSLVVSTAAPVFAAPISHLKARSEDAGPSLSARDGISSPALDLTDRNVPRGDSPVTTEDLVNAILTARDSGSGQGIQARSFLDILELGFNALNQVLRRDVTPEMLLARDSVNELVNSIISRDLRSEDDMALASRRDVASDRLGARLEYDDLLKILNTRRNAIDDILATREPSSKQQTQARDSDSATTSLDALLQSRDVSTRSGLSTADLLRIIASRALEDLD